MQALRPTLFLLLFFVAIGCLEGCENSSPQAGDECTVSGGVCSKSACGASLPYPCVAGESCCQPPPSRDAGARD